jgi:chromosome segregation ATPase
MPTDNSTLDKVINLRQLQMAHEDLNSRTVQLEETVDPASADVINEYQRVLAELYQALTDAQAVIAPAEQGAADASGAATRAAAAAERAGNAAGAAERAAMQIEDARGDYASLEARLDAIDGRYGFVETADPMSLVGA